jgi:hypothetical protein
MHFEMLETIIYTVVLIVLSAKYIFPTLILKVIDIDIYIFKKAGFLGLLPVLTLKVLAITNILKMM